MSDAPELSVETHVSVFSTLLLVYYCILCLLGTVGNVWVLRVVYKVLRTPWQPSQSMPQHLVVYIGALSLVDFLVLSAIPFIALQLWHHQWLLGEALCKYFWTIDNMAKLLSIAILTALSVDRYCSVCKQLQYIWLHRKSTVVYIIVALAIIILMLLFPVLTLSSVEERQIYFSTVNASASLLVCSFDALVPSGLLNAFIAYMFVLGFCLPATVITVCYSRLIIFVRSHSIVAKYNSRDHRLSVGTEQRSRQVMVQLSHSVRRVIFFHFVCWTPYWLFTLLPLLKKNPAADSTTFTLVHVFVHSLPYVNSAGNWVFYALLNKRLVQMTEAPTYDTRLLSSAQSDSAVN